MSSWGGIQRLELALPGTSEFVSGTSENKNLQERRDGAVLRDRLERGPGSDWWLGACRVPTYTIGGAVR